MNAPQLAASTPPTGDVDNCTRNCSGATTAAVDYPYSSELKLGGWEVVVLASAYVVVFVVGVVGNAFVLAVVARSRNMWNVTNMFISNLAMADLFVLVFCLPFNLLNSLYESYPFGMVVCKMVAYLQGVSVNTSVCSLVAISVDRYLAICHPMKFQVTTRCTRIVMSAIWLYSCALFLPWICFFDVVRKVYDARGVVVLGCEERWPQPTGAKWFLVCVVIMLVYVAPLLLISVCYLRIFLQVWKRRLVGDATNYERVVYRQKLAVIRMLLIVVLIFALSWLPLYVLFIVITFAPSESVAWPVVARLVPTVQWLITSNSAINPCLYAWLNKKYRVGFLGILRSCCGNRRGIGRDGRGSCGRGGGGGVTLSSKHYSTTEHSQDYPVAPTANKLMNNCSGTVMTRI